MTILESVEQAANLQSLIDAAAEAAPAQSKSGVKRTAEIEAALSNSDLDELMDLQFKMNKVVERILAVKLDPDALGALDPETLSQLAVEQLELKDIERLLEVRYQLRRLAIFAHITEDNKVKEVKDPENATGKVFLVDLAKKWVRTGGTLRSRLDREGLRKALGEKKWAKVIDKIEVPATEAHVEEVFNEDKLYALIQEDTKLMMVLADHVVPGGRTPQVLNLRDMTQADYQELKGLDD